MAGFISCTVTSCVRRMEGKKVRANYQIEETCHYAKNDMCPYKKKERETMRAK